jgi:hypothetical protein
MFNVHYMLFVTHALSILTILSLKNRSVLTIASYHIFNFALLLASNQMTNISYNLIRSVLQNYYVVGCTDGKENYKEEARDNIFWRCTTV